MVSIPYPVVLASASPRRQELLRRLLPEFRVRVSDVDEEALTGEDPWSTAEGLAVAKARAVARLEPESLVIGGDTVVAVSVRGREEPFSQLAKPRDEHDAFEMLRRLSGREHAVITGVAMVSPRGERSGADTTWVRFRELSDDEIRAYVATGEPMDKAGAYAIQGGAGPFVLGTEGSVTNVIGFPMEMVERMLMDFA